MPRSALVSATSHGARCRDEIESLIETTPDLVVVATASCVWGIAEEALDMLNLKDAPPGATLATDAGSAREHAAERRHGASREGFRRERRFAGPGRR